MDDFKATFLDYFDFDGQEEAYYWACTWGDSPVKLTVAAALFSPDATGSGSEYAVTVQPGTSCCGASLAKSERVADESEDHSPRSHCMGCGAQAKLPSYPGVHAEVILLRENSVEPRARVSESSTLETAMAAWCEAGAANPLELPLIVNTCTADILAFAKQTVRDSSWQELLMEEREEFLAQ